MVLGMRLIPWLLTSESDFIECGVDGFGILNSTSLIKYSSFTKHFSQALQFGVIEVLAADLFGRRLFLNITDCLAHNFHLKKMPGRTGRMEARVYGVPSLAGDAGFTAQRHRNGALL
jgi:hypothetical protein